MSDRLIFRIGVLGICGKYPLHITHNTLLTILLHGKMRMVIHESESLECNISILDNQVFGFGVTTPASMLEIVADQSMNIIESLFGLEVKNEKKESRAIGTGTEDVLLIIPSNAQMVVLIWCKFCSTKRHIALVSPFAVDCSKPGFEHFEQLLGARQFSRWCRSGGPRASRR